MGRDVGRWLWKELGEGKPMIKINCMKTIFKEEIVKHIGSQRPFVYAILSW